MSMKFVCSCGEYEGDSEDGLKKHQNHSETDCDSDTDYHMKVV